MSTNQTKPISYERVVIRSEDDAVLAGQMLNQAAGLRADGSPFVDGDGNAVVTPIRVTNIVPVQRDENNNPVTDTIGNAIPMVPTGFVQAVLPINERVDKYKRNADGSIQLSQDPETGITKKVTDGKTDTTTGLLVLAIPDMLTIAGDDNLRSDEALEFINEACDRANATKALNAFDKKTHESDKVPSALKDWLTSQKIEGLGEDFAAMMEATAKWLKSQGYAAFTPTHVRACLRDAGYAAVNFGNIKAEFWSQLLDKTISNMAEKGNATATLERWKAERDTRGTDEAVQELSLSDLEFGADAS